MNRFSIHKGREGDFEKIWMERNTQLHNVKGFLKFNLLKGETTDKQSLYASHSTWDSRKDFVNWTKSEAFRETHKGVGKRANINIGHPVFEGFEVVI